MPKRIVLFSDGTWNTWSGRQTNVVRLCRLLAEIPGEQLIQYDPGVGTGLLKLAGGAFGVGISRNIKDLYRFLVRHYEPGDLVYLFGFSRGAFTVRSLGGLLEVCGILESSRIGLVNRAFQLYKAGPSREAEYFRASYSHSEFEIRVLGVWDTVGSLGVPFDKLNRLNPFSHRFHDTRLGRHVRYALHGVAVDEGRFVYRPTLWTEQPRSPEEGSAAFEQEIRQVWLAGAHADVGGGYDQRGLADASLAWMLGQLRELAPELELKPERQWPFALNPRPDAMLHDSRKHLWRLWPRYFRTIKPGALVHRSVSERIERLTNYRPENLPREPRWVE